jgi:hypothetical protein
MRMQLHFSCIAYLGTPDPIPEHAYSQHKTLIFTMPDICLPKLNFED